MVILIAGAVAGAALLACALALGWFLPAFGRGEFMTADFDLDEAQSYVDDVLATDREWDGVGTVLRLPPQFSHLSVGGETLIWADHDTHALSVQFWARRGIQSSDVYVFLEEGREVGCGEQTSIEEIAANWYFVRNCD